MGKNFGSSEEWMGHKKERTLPKLNVLDMLNLFCFVYYFTAYETVRKFYVKKTF